MIYGICRWLIMAEKSLRQRKLFIAQLNEWLEQIHGKLTGNREKLQLVYQPSTEPEDFERALLSKKRAGYPDENVRNRTAQR